MARFFSRKAALRAALLVTAIISAACTTLGPDYEEPSVEWLEEWQTDLYGQLGNQAQQTEVDLRFWWHLFDDPVLNQLIDTARRQNPTLRIAGLRILESRALLGVAGSLRYPQVQQVSSAVAYVNTNQHGGVASDSDGSLTSYQAAFNVGWELDFWGRFRRSIESAEAAFFNSITNHYDAQVLLSAQVADLYFAYLTTAQRIAIARENATAQRRSFDITRRLYRSGQKGELDLQQAKTQYLATLATIPELEVVLTQLRNALSVLLARAPGDVPELGAAEGELPVVEPIVIREVPARLLARRPDIRSAAWLVAAQSAQIGVAKAEFYPAISLFGSLGWSGNSLDRSPDTSTVSVGPSLTWNVFDYGRIRNNVRVQDARLQQTIEAFQLSVLQAAREIDDAAVGVVKYHERQSVLDEAVAAARRSLELANIRYTEGYADFQRVLDAQRTQITQADRALVNRGNQISAVISLYKAIGGGWLDMSVEEMLPEADRDAMQTRSNWGDLMTEPLPALPPGQYQTQETPNE